MRYTVISRPSADDELIQIWMQAPNRLAVRQAADTIERFLKRSPLSFRHLWGNRYTMTADPLTVEYEVSPDDCLVSIYSYTYTP